MLSRSEDVLFSVEVGGRRGKVREKSLTYSREHGGQRDRIASFFENITSVKVSEDHLAAHAKNEYLWGTREVSRAPNDWSLEDALTLTNEEQGCSNVRKQKPE